MKKLIEYIKSRPSLSISGLAFEMGYKKPQYLHDVIAGRRNMSDKVAFKLACVLSRYGLELDGCLFQYNEVYNVLHCAPFNGSKETFHMSEFIERFKE